MSTMGERIHQKREESGLTMEELGEKLGVQKSAVNKWEKGQVENIKRSVIARMAEIFQCRPSWLGYEDSPEVSITYEAPGKESVRLIAAHKPIMGTESKIVELYNLVLSIKPENYDIAIKLLKTLV